jgi:hypothetical protein
MVLLFHSVILFPAKIKVGGGGKKMATLGEADRLISIVLIGLLFAPITV